MVVRTNVLLHSLRSRTEECKNERKISWWMVLSVSDLGKRYGSNLLFRGLSVQLRGKEILAVAGTNGMGKSTLLKILAGVVPPSAGSVELSINGHKVHREQWLRYAGLVSSEFQMYTSMSARENLHFLARARDAKVTGSDIGVVLARVGLSCQNDVHVRVYSSGMAQRLRIAAALLFNPPLLLLDEPMVNLDSEGRDLVTQVIYSSADEGRLTVYATNEVSELAYATKIIDLQDFA